ncbi:MAG: hypothetical protein J6P19_00170, partial [Acetobacter sp.]|nr:hypothetical protein [Acetobacter sp.]
QELQLARVANHALAVTNCLKAITNFKGLIALVFIFVSLIIILTAGWWWWISKKYDETYRSRYEAATAAYITKAKAGAAWAMSESGQEAQALDQEGLIQAFYHCRLKGFYKQRQNGNLACLPDGSGGGWWLPN